MMDESRYQRLQLMDGLRNQSLTYKEISKVMNDLGIVTPTNRHYTANNVERSLMKYRWREGRRLSKPDIQSTDILMVSALGLSACSNAKTANEVNAAYVPTGKYERMSCKSLRAENREAERELADMTAAIEKSYRDDKTAEVVAWFLFAPALLMMDGNSEEQKEYGEAKGRVLAIQDVMDSKGC